VTNLRKEVKKEEKEIIAVALDGNAIITVMMVMLIPYAESANR